MLILKSTFTRKTLALGMACLCMATHLGQLPAEAADVVAATALANHDMSHVPILTKQILLKAIELNKFNIHYRLETQKQPKTRRLRYFASQEAGLANLMAYDIITTKEFGQNRNTPLKLSIATLRGALNTALVAEAIAMSGSIFELGSNAIKCVKDKHNGFDNKTANKYFFKTLKELDDLFLEREAIIEAHPEYPGYQILVTEGKVMRQLRDYYVLEYATFYREARGIRAYLNTFYFLNAATNAVGLASILCGLKSLKVPQYNGPANILFTTAGGIAMAAPLVATGAGHLCSGQAHKTLVKTLTKEPSVNYDALEADRTKLKTLIESADATTLLSIGPIEERRVLYREADKGFQETLAAESKRLRHLQKVAVQSNFFGPLIGATTMTQGILGTWAYYKYGKYPTLANVKKSLTLNYAGSIVGLTGFATGVGVNAQGLGANWLYDRRLKASNKGPEILLKDHLNLLEKVEAQVKAMD